MNYENLCSICLEPLRNNVVTLNCGHSFHIHCISRWAAQNQPCPLCRTQYTRNNMNRLGIPTTPLQPISHNFNIRNENSPVEPPMLRRTLIPPINLTSNLNQERFLERQGFVQMPENISNIPFPTNEITSPIMVRSPIPRRPTPARRTRRRIRLNPIEQENRIQSLTTLPTRASLNTPPTTPTRRTRRSN